MNKHSFQQKNPLIIVFCEREIQVEGLRNWLSGDFNKIYSEMFSGDMTIRILEGMLHGTSDKGILTIKYNDKLLAKCNLIEKCIYDQNNNKIGYYENNQPKNFTNLGYLIVAKNVYINSEKTLTTNWRKNFGKEERLFSEYNDHNKESLLIALAIVVWQIMLTVRKKGTN